MRSQSLSHTYLWSGWIDKLNSPRVDTRGHHHPLPEFFLRITHISEIILSILTKLCPNVPWVILFQSYVRYVWGSKRGPKMINYFNIYKSSSCEPTMPEDWCLAHNIDKSWKQESSLTKWFWLATRLLHLWCFLDFFNIKLSKLLIFVHFIFIKKKTCFSLIILLWWRTDEFPLYSKFPQGKILYL